MKKALITALKIVGFILGIILIYVLLVFLIPLISVKAEATSDPKTIEAYILSNGVHTDIVVPTKTDQVDWSTKVLYANTKGQKIDFQYTAFGWGDKGFYLDTPTWADLKASTAIEAAFWLGDSAMHVTFYNSLKPGKDCKKIMLTQDQYSRLIHFIDDRFDKDIQGNYRPIITNAIYGDDDAFYDAKGSYSFLYTCNTWANNALKAAGQKAALWSATDFGILRHYE